MDIQQFQEKLKDIQTLAMQNGKQVHVELVEQFFDEPGMDREKLQKVYDFLEIQGIYIEGYSRKNRSSVAENRSESAAASDMDSVSGDSSAFCGDRENRAEMATQTEQTALTSEEETFLEEYLEGFVLPESAERESILQKFKEGKDCAPEDLLRSLQEDLVQAAKVLNCPEIFFGDLLQEGNMGLLMALQNRSEQECSVEWLLEEAKSAMRLFIEDMTQQKKEDNILVEKVRNLEARVKELTEDENIKYSVEELAAFLDMDPEEMEAVLQLTGDDK